MSPSVADLLQVFQANMDEQLTNVCGKLDSIGSRMDLLETRQKTLEEEIRTTASASSSSSSPATTCTLRDNMYKRHHITPPVMQVLLHVLYIFL